MQCVSADTIVQKLAVGTIPRTIWVVLEDDLVDSCKPGDDVTIYGVVMRRWKPVYNNSKCEIELAIRANNLVVNNDQRSSVTLTEDMKREFDEFWQRHELHPLMGRNELLSSLCPQIFGLYLVKLSVALTLIGGIQRISKSGTKVRGESHLLLVGDPVPVRRVLLPEYQSNNIEKYFVLLPICFLCSIRFNRFRSLRDF
eukprot:Seg1899.4 transcript_id=Seg1899.4/GoldUCD/mRNA.D3Y31 product="DNA helicase MCM9" protein_id=Seg1899.4/GoldUCD/D3Y31